MHRLDQCGCGRPKCAVAAVCLTCFKANKAASKAASKAEKPRKGRHHPHDRCACGRSKVVGAATCLACYLERVQGNNSLRLKCACGGPKSYKASICVKCYKDSKSRNSTYCCGCDRHLSTSDFYTSRSGQTRSRCKSCNRKEGRRSNIIRRCLRYGATTEEAVKIADLDSTACEICGRVVEKFHIDHCHVTNKFRGLLCSNCNAGIGLLNDDPELCSRAASYLRGRLSVSEAEAICANKSRLVCRRHIE